MSTKRPEKIKSNKVTLNNFDYEVYYKDKKVFEIPAAKKDKIQMLRRFVTNECEHCWALQPSNIAAMKRRFLTELVDSLNT